MTDDIKAALRDMGFGAPLAMEALGGGVSCDVFLVELGEGRRICVKRALPKLRVAADWFAPAERAEAEVAWIRVVAGLDPRWVPKILGEDKARHVFAMEYLPYPVWKSELAEGRIDAGFAAKVGTALARIHAVRGIAERFANGAQFHALRIEPYLLFTAERHPDVAPRIRAIADGVASARIGLMHGDVSPKNILCGPEGPVFLDAECACWGDPAFDLAFCLNHLMLKCLWVPAGRQALLDSFHAMAAAYLQLVDWEPAAALETRAAHLLPALFLARVDGKSPVEYITQDAHRDKVRGVARRLLADPPDRLADVARAWNKEMTA